MSIVARVRKCPGRRRSVLVSEENATTTMILEFPDLWFTDIIIDGRIDGFVVTNGEPTLGKSVKMAGSTTCVGADAMRRFLDGEITSAEAYFSTSSYRDNWIGHKDFWRSTGRSSFWEIFYSSLSNIDVLRIKLVKE